MPNSVNRGNKAGYWYKIDSSWFVFLFSSFGCLHLLWFSDLNQKITLSQNFIKKGNVWQLKKKSRLSAHTWVTIPSNSYTINFWNTEYYWKAKCYTIHSLLSSLSGQWKHKVQCQMEQINAEDWCKGKYLHH